MYICMHIYSMIRIYIAGICGIMRCNYIVINMVQTYIFPVNIGKKDLAYNYFSDEKIFFLEKVS